MHPCARSALHNGSMKKLGVSSALSYLTAHVRRCKFRSVPTSFVASLIETCKLNAVEPLGYLADVLTRIVNGHPNSQIDDLLPWAYIRAPALRAVA